MRVKLLAGTVADGWDSSFVRSESNTKNFGAKSAQAIGASSSRRDKVSATTIDFPQPVFHRQVIAKKLAHLSMLRNCRETLVEDELQDVVVVADCERLPPQVWSPVADGLDHAD